MTQSTTSMLNDNADPFSNTQALDMLARQGVTALAVDEVPRVTRAQKLDVK